MTGNEARSQKPRFVISAVALFVAGLTLGLAGSALAAQSAITRGTPTAQTPSAADQSSVCFRSRITNPGLNHQTDVWLYGSTSSCGGGLVPSPPNHFGAYNQGFRDGQYCGATGWFYNGNGSSSFTVGMSLCSNPAGIQSFSTVSWARGWNVPTGTYHTYGTVNSGNEPG
jgi:hypothetical protein